MFDWVLNTPLNIDKKWVGRSWRNFPWNLVFGYFFFQQWLLGHQTPSRFISELRRQLLWLWLMSITILAKDYIWYFFVCRPPSWNCSWFLAYGLGAKSTSNSNADQVAGGQSGKWITKIHRNNFREAFRVYHAWLVGK